jgi:hypothetical protein
MSHRITISAGPVTVEAELNESPTAQRIWDQLPISQQANTWGDEIYFRIPVQMEEAADADADVEVGALAYWPPGGAFCIFFGPTPASDGEQPRAASPVNVVGRVLGDASALRQVGPGATVIIEKAE